MSKAFLKTTRIFALSLCIALLFANTLILAPEVGAASETTKTETEMNINSDITEAEDAVLTQRAIAIDEAKKEAQVVVTEQLAIIAQEEEEEEEEAAEEETETLQDQAQEPDAEVDDESSVDTSYEEATAGTDTDEETYDEEPSEEPASEEQPSEEEETTSDSDETADSSSASDEDETEDSTDTEGAGYAEPAYGFLMGIDNPDPNYVGTAISMSDSERDLCERMIMGEAGSCGYTGMALVAQCIRDTYVAGGYTSINDVLSQNGYYGSTSITPSAECKEVVSYIFDQGGSAVQHRVRVFYASNYCTSSWHEAQEFVCSIGYVRFFDM